jgi:hypothetical protein
MELKMVCFVLLVVDSFLNVTQALWLLCPPSFSGKSF